MFGVILAGGRGERMGGDKPGRLLSGRPLLQWAIDALQQVASPIFVAVAPGQALPEVTSAGPLFVVEDVLPRRGPLGGIYTGLWHTGAERILTVPCDAPLVRPELLRLLMAHATDAEAVVPEVGGRVHAAIGVYARSCLPAFLRAVEGPDLSVRSFLALVETVYAREPDLRRADPDLRSFLNANTPGDLARIGELLGSGSPVS